MKYMTLNEIKRMRPYFTSEVDLQILVEHLVELASLQETMILNIRRENAILVSTAPSESDGHFLSHWLEDD